MTTTKFHEHTRQRVTTSPPSPPSPLPPSLLPFRDDNDNGRSKEQQQQQQQKDKIRSLLLHEAGFDITATAANRPNTATAKRRDYLCWNDFFFGVAVLSSRRSKNPIAPYGACIVDALNRVVGIGYDGLPKDCPDAVIPYEYHGNNSTSLLHTQHPYICHAEVNAILNKCSADVAGCRMYVERFPCNECAKVIIQSRIREVWYLYDDCNDNQDNNNNNNSEDTDDCYRASRILFAMAGIKTVYCTPSVSSIDLDFVRALAPTTTGTTVIDTTSSTDEVDHATTTATSSSPHQQKHKFRDLMIREAHGYDPITTPSSHRMDYLSWDDYFMAMAFLTAKRSKDPNTQVGAVIVQSSDTKRILALGYNGFPRGCSDDALPWGRHPSLPNLHKKYLYVVHAEVNAVLNRGSANVQGATLYVALFPCNDCAKVIIQAGIQEVVFMSDQYHDTDACRASRIMFQMAGVRLRKHTPSVQSLRLRLGSHHNSARKEHAVKEKVSVNVA